uniref:Uncharacterized protein n=1 Tax=viral metagenome TaxID=1070528 RepID=A0A6M3JEJ1_9ZZZZ
MSQTYTLDFLRALIGIDRSAIYTYAMKRSYEIRHGIEPGERKDMEPERMFDFGNHRFDFENHQLALIESAHIGLDDLDYQRLELSLSVRVLGGCAGLRITGSEQILEFLRHYNAADVRDLQGKACRVWVEPCTGTASIKLVGGL